MFQRVMPVLLCGLLAACGDPLEGFDRLGDVDLPEQSAQTAALPTEEEVLREGYFGTAAATGEGASSVAVAADEKPVARSGLFGLFRPAPTDDQPEAVAQTPLQTRDEAPAQKAAETDGTQSPAIAPKTNAQPSRTGFFGRLLARAPESDGAALADATVQTNTPAAPEDVELASLAPASEPVPEPARRGLFGRPAPQTATAAPRTGPDAKDVVHGTILPFGAVARSCDTKKSQLGRKIDKAPAKGYTLYDSKPNTAAPRTFYITGFSDGCPRQLTAANVLLGSAALYERLHYGPGGEFLPVGATDKAYEKVKRRVCGTGRNKPCGGKIKQMERTTFFVSAYERFGNANTWSELLIHDGQVLASAIKSNN